MSDFEEIFELIKRGEDQTMDFKQHITSPSKIAKTIVAFANTDGGEIVIGIDDQGDIRGVDIDQERFMMIRAAKQYCDPPIHLHFKKFRVKRANVLIVKIDKSQLEHAAANDMGDWTPYVRVFDQTVVMPGMEESKHSDKPIPILDEEQMGLINYLEEYESITVKDYMRIMNISYGLAKRSLRELCENDVLEEEFFNNIPHYYLRKHGNIFD